MLTIDEQYELLRLSERAPDTQEKYDRIQELLKKKAEPTELQKAWDELIMEVCKALKIPQFVEWLSKRLK